MDHPGQGCVSRDVNCWVVVASRQATDIGKQGAAGGNERRAGADLFESTGRQRDEPNNSIRCFHTKTPDICLSQSRVRLEEDAEDNLHMAGLGESECASFWVENGDRGVDESKLDGSESLGN